MRRQYRILIALVIALAAICASPFLVRDWVRLWIWWNARRENLTVKIDKIEAPFLHPVVLSGVHVSTAPNATFRVELSATQVAGSLNFQTILLRMRGRGIKNLSVTGLHVEIHRTGSGTPFPEQSWMTWQKLLPNNGHADGFDFRIEDGATVILLRGGSLTVSEIEAGRVSIDELTIASPIIRQTFSHLRGATRWQENHLTLAGLSLTRGLDAQSITADLSRLGKKRVGLEFDLDAFGGKIRGEISNEWRSRSSNWNIVGSAADISLGQTSEAIGLADPIAGQMHACKFTFRGDLHDPTHAIASLWTELTAPVWHDRKADVIMLGAAFYNRQINLQQLYVKQSKNQLTLSGEASFPEKSFDWLNPDFRGNISASINNLGDFAALFGATRGDFAGEIAVNGTMNARDRKVGGQITASGNGVTVFKTSVDAFRATVSLKGTQLELEELKLSRGDDFLSAQCKIDIGPRRNAAGGFDFSAKKLSSYVAKSIFTGAVSGRIDFSNQNATSEWLQFTDGAITVSLNSTIDFADWNNIHAALVPQKPLFDRSAPNSGDCIDHVQFAPAPSPKKRAPPILAIDKLEITGAFASGVRNIKFISGAGEKHYRVLCGDQPNRALEIGAARQ